MTVRKNLVKNPSFGTNTTGWSIAAANGIPSGSLSRVTAQFAVGTASLQAASGVGSAGHGIVTSTPIPVVGGGDYAMQFRSKAGTTARGVVLGVTYANGSGPVAGGFSVNLGANSTSDWTTFSHAFMVPAGATLAAVSVMASVGFSAENHFYDALMLEQASSVGDYFDGDTADSVIDPDSNPTTGGECTVTRFWAGTAHDAVSGEVICCDGFDYLRWTVLLPLHGWPGF